MNSTVSTSFPQTGDKAVYRAVINDIDVVTHMIGARAPKDGTVGFWPTMTMCADCGLRYPHAHPHVWITPGVHTPNAFVDRNANAF